MLRTSSRVFLRIFNSRIPLKICELFNENICGESQTRIHKKNLFKQNREMLKMERLKARAREIFQRLEINLCFLDDELLKEFMKEYKITVQDHNLAVLRNREKLGVFEKDLVRLFARIIVDKIEEMHNFTLVSGLFYK